MNKVVPKGHYQLRSPTGHLYTATIMPSSNVVSLGVQ